MLLKQKQYPMSFDCLEHRGASPATNWLPTNLDGLTERCGRFLILECKTEMEGLSIGQHRMLKRLAQLPQFCVIVVTMFRRFDDDKQTRLFVPIYFERLGADGTLSEQVISSEANFAKRYREWCLNPFSTNMWESNQPAMAETGSCEQCNSQNITN